MIKVQGYPGLYRDENTGAIVNCNDSEYKHRLNKINAVDSQREEINRLRNQNSSQQGENILKIDDYNRQIDEM